MGTVYEPAGGADKPTESEKLLVIIDAAGQPSMRKDKEALGVGSLGKVAESEEATLASQDRHRQWNMGNAATFSLRGRHPRYSFVAKAALRLWWVA